MFKINNLKHDNQASELATLSALTSLSQIAKIKIYKERRLWNVSNVFKDLMVMLLLSMILFCQFLIDIQQSLH